MIQRTLLLLSFCIAPVSVQAAWNIGAGLENYTWTEYPAGAANTPKESGMRAAWFFDWAQEKDEGPQFAWHGKLYGGTVNYDTYVVSTGAPITTQTDYSGVMNEGQLFFRKDQGNYKLDYIAGLGFDFWRRGIRNTGFSQIEDYSVLFLRLGMRLGKSRMDAGFHAECGIKYPVSTWEDAHLPSLGYTSNPSISPSGVVSGYVELGYRIAPQFDVVGYYDSWRFDRSGEVRTNKPTDPAGSYWLVHQPKSDMDAIGIKLLVSY